MLPFNDNPLRAANVPQRVELRHGKDAYRATRAALEPFDLSAVKGLRVLIKPNAGRMASPGEGVTTNPAVVAAAIDAFSEAGGDAFVGESPITGVDTMAALAATGIAAVARERDCPLVDLDEKHFETLTHADGVAMQSFKACADVLAADLVVSVPVMKTHMHTGVTLSVKNMKGCLWRRSKVDLHMLDPVPDRPERPLALAINDMAHVLRPHFAVIDGTVGMEGLGPSAGSPKALHVVVAAVDAYAADSVACRLMGMDPDDIVHLRLGARDSLGVLEREKLDVSPAGWEEWCDPFDAAPKKIDLEFENVRILDCQSCSACQSTLLLFLKRYGDRLLDCVTGTANVAIGKGHDEVSPGTLCIGNCTARHRAKGVFVPGCPPVGSNIMKAIEQSGDEG